MRVVADLLLKEPAPKSLVFKWYGPDDVAYSLGGISSEGKLRTYSLSYKADALGRIDLTHLYLEKLARIVGGQVRRTDEPQEWYVVKQGTELPGAKDVLSQPTEWLDAMRWYIGELRSAIELLA